MSACGLAAAACVGTYVVSALPPVRGLHDWIVPGAIWRTTHPHVVLSFDDGPDPRRTPRLLDVLATRDAKAIFFVVGERAERYPDIVRRIAAEGHLLGNHTWSHPWMLALSRARIGREIACCQEVIERCTGERPVLARPPYGQRDFRIYRALRRHELTPVLWSLDPRDYRSPPPRVLAGRLARARPGDIVLLHDGAAGSDGTVGAGRQWLASAPPIGLL